VSPWGKAHAENGNARRFKKVYLTQGSKKVQHHNGRGGEPGNRMKNRRIGDQGTWGGGDNRRQSKCVQNGGTLEHEEKMVSFKNPKTNV